MSAVNVGADDVGSGVLDKGIAINDGSRGEGEARRRKGAVTVAPIQDHLFIEDDGHAQAVRLDVGDEPVELLALHQGEDVGEGMKPEGFIFGRAHDAASSPMTARSNALREATQDAPTLRPGTSPRSRR